MGLDQFQVWKLLPGFSAHKSVYVVPVLDLIEAMVLTVSFGLNHGLVRPGMTLNGNQGVERTVYADQRLANDATVCE